MRTRAAFIPAALCLVIVGAAQLVLAHHSNLSPWKGGGFGMFATVDSPALRSLHLSVETDDGSRTVALPPGLELAALETRTLPTNRRARRLARAVARQLPAGDSPACPATLRVEIRRARLERGPPMSEARLVRDDAPLVSTLWPLPGRDCPGDGAD